MSTTIKRTGACKQLPLSLAILLGLYGAPALAQQAAQAPADPEEEARGEQVLERVQVTGSLIRRLEIESIAPVQVLSADLSADLGQLETSEILQQSNVAAGSTQISEQFSAFVIEGGTGVQTINLRGLGPVRNLVLLDGRRPGPAGTRGQVGAFDLNVIPSAMIQRIEILKDGASSIYGSDAVAGVVNVITRKNIDRPTFSFDMQVPLDAGGEAFSASGATGWNFDNGSVIAGVTGYQSRPLLQGDRDFFRCPQDLFRDQAGNLIDREDRSIIAGTALGGCSSGNLYANTVIDALTGARYIPAPNGVTIGLIPGYRPRVNPTYANSSQAAYEDVLNFDFMNDQQIIDEQKRKSVYVAADFTFGDIRWDANALFNRRSTDSRRYRQFFPLVGGATSPIASFRYPNSPTYVAAVPSGVAQPVMPFRSDQSIEVDYVYLSSGLEGEFGGDRFWSWQVFGSYTRSDGDYSALSIVANRSGDVQFDRNAPRLNYFSPRFLSGEGIDELEAAIGEWHTGNTIYDQKVVSALLTGELFDAPGGTVGTALGLEHRRFSIDDQPSELSRSGNLWGQSSALVTKGQDNVTEIFGEIDVPLLAGLPAIESLTFNASARAFDYDSVDGTDKVWKMGLGWQVVPSVRLRGTKGTSFRAPALYELFLGNQTGFVGQLAIDPCIQWGDSTNDRIRTNCAAAGIPSNFPGGAASALVISSGGAGLLNPEKSNAETVGIVFTPSFANFSVAFDYYKIELRDQVTQLGAGQILGGCYNAEVFPNAFCDLFDRNSPTAPTAPNAISTVRSVYLNINRQQVRGYDLLIRYDRDFSFGGLQLEGNFTYQYEDISQLFDSAQASGFRQIDRNGSIGNPKLVGNVRTAFNRGDWTYTWGMNYVDSTEALNVDPVTTYFGRPNSVRDIKAESALYHTLSLRYGQDSWDVLVGVNNIFDKAPPEVSSGVASRYGNVPAFATQYDWLGRRLFARLSYRF
jgi:iron complex outermembrane recepter protein